MKNVEANLKILYNLINEYIYWKDKDKITPEMIAELKPHLKEVMEYQLKDYDFQDMIADDAEYILPIAMGRILYVALRKMSIEKAGYEMKSLGVLDPMNPFDGAYTMELTPFHTPMHKVLLESYDITQKAS